MVDPATRGRGRTRRRVWAVDVGIDLPRHYVANHRDLARVGLDSAPITMLMGAAGAGSRRRNLRVVFATATTTLLVVDAWFHATTVRRGHLFQSVVLAVLVEMPSALV